MKNQARLVKIDLDERLGAVIENVNDNGLNNFKDCLGCLIFATNEGNAVDMKVWETALKEFYQVDVETTLQGEELSKENVLSMVNWSRQKDQILNSLRANYKPSLDQSITTMVAAIAKRNLLSLKTQAILLSSKFGIEMEEVLDGTELNIATSVLAGQL